MPIADKNPSTAICSAQAFPGQAWVHNEIPVLLDYYAAHWQGAYNHGLSQNLELLKAVCAYPAGQWGGRPATWRKTALSPTSPLPSSRTKTLLGPAVDAQGVSNEQATGYANFSYGLWTTAEADVRACGLSLPGWVTGRIAKMPLFLALATQPDGKLAQIGDTYRIAPRNRAHTPLRFAATRGESGHRAVAAHRRLRRRVRVRTVGLGNREHVRQPVLLLAPVRAGNPDSRPRRSHGPHLLRTRQEPDRQRGPLRLREHAVPRVPAVT